MVATDTVSFIKSEHNAKLDATKTSAANQSAVIDNMKATHILEKNQICKKNEEMRIELMTEERIKRRKLNVQITKKNRIVKATTRMAKDEIKRAESNNTRLHADRQSLEKSFTKTKRLAQTRKTVLNEKDTIISCLRDDLEDTKDHLLDTLKIMQTKDWNHKEELQKLKERISKLETDNNNAVEELYVSTIFST
jgi:hypothetical protein